MVDNRNDPRGSVWRKWDFQVHTPESHLNNQFGADWDAYVQGLFRAAMAKGLAVIAVTDYFTVDGYKKLKEVYLGDPAKMAVLFSADEIEKINAITVLANVEFRLRNIVNESRVNAHVIFSDEVPIRDIEENFLHDLDFTDEAQPQTTAQKRKLKVENLRALGARLQTEQPEFKAHSSPLFTGMMNAVVDDDQIMERLKDSRFKDKFLFCVVADEDLPKMKWVSQAHLSRKVLIQRSDALFSANPSTRKWALGEEPYTEGSDSFIREFMTLKPCLHGSDAHGYDEIGHPCAKRGKKDHVCDLAKPEACDLRYCWIKSDTTFEGLRQTLLEPADRVFIGPSAPDFHDQARVISSITFSNGQGWFEDVEILLNSGMVSIIGQKGSGKSALADLTAYAAGSWLDDDENCFLHRADPHLNGMKLSLRWADGTVQEEIVDDGYSNDNSVKYLSQDYVERICARDGVTKELVREIENVIFNYIDPVETLNASDFSELRALKTASVIAEGDRLKSEIETIIREEFARRDLVGKLGEKQAREKALATERDGLIKQLPAPATPEEAKLLQQLQEKRDALSKVQQAAAGQKQNLQRLEDLRKRADAFGAQIERYFEDLKPALNEAGIPEGDWAAFKPAFTHDYRKPLQARKAVIDASLAALEGGDPPAENTIRKLNAEIEELSKRETADKARQDRTKQLQTRIATLNADILRVQAEIKNIEEVERPKLMGVQSRRLDAYQAYFANLASEQGVLESLYEPIRERLNERALLKGRDVEFAIRWSVDLQRWLERGEVLFDQRRTLPYGSFSGLAAAARKILLPAWASGDAVKIRSALDEFLGPFRELQPDTYLRANVGVRDLMAWFYEVEHITLDYGLKFNGSDLESLSPGTKGIVLLILYLGMDVNDSRPLIVDQPDENLDNESIYNLLTPYFRMAKSRRQVIVITHNPNLVVNSDSEQIIIASAEKQENGFPAIRYASTGSLENPDIRQQVCNILEGGNDAFLKRERRYAIARR